MVKILMQLSFSLCAHCFSGSADADSVGTQLLTEWCRIPAHILFFRLPWAACCWRSSVRAMWVVALCLGNPDGSAGACRADEIAFSQCFKPWLIEPQAWSQTAFCCILIWSQFQSLPKLKIQNMSVCASRSHIVCTHLENTWVASFWLGVLLRLFNVMKDHRVHGEAVLCLPVLGPPTVCFLGLF